MIVSLKDAFKLFGIIVVTCCAVCVCTFFLNFYIDAKSIESLLNDENSLILYNAQMATAKFTCAISGGFLGLVAVVMLAFYLKLYIDNNLNRIGVLKAMGYSDCSIALRFTVFGLSVFAGAVLGFGLGFIIMPTVYEGLTISGLPEIAIKFHPTLLLELVIAPTAVFSFLSFLYALLALRIPVSEMLRGKAEKVKAAKVKKDKERGFLKEICIRTLTGKKALAFFVAFACFCFSAMVQMGASMYDLSTETMGEIIFVMGVVLAVTTIFMAVTSLVRGNIKNIAVMKTCGYSLKECCLSVLGGYHIFALIGFAAGTAYQYILLSLMVNIVYKDVASVPDYNFNVPVFFITLAVFIVFYEAVMLFFTLKINKISVKEVMAEN